MALGRVPVRLAALLGAGVLLAGATAVGAAQPTNRAPLVQTAAVASPNIPRPGGEQPRQAPARARPSPTPGAAVPAARGAAGLVVRVEPDGLVILTSRRVERSIRLLPNVLIRRGGRPATIGDLRRGDRVVVLGQPRKDGSIMARAITARPAPGRQEAP